MDRESLLIRSLLSPKASSRGPNRKVSLIMDKMNRIDQVLREIKDQEDSERATLEELISQAEDISQKAKENISICESIKGVLGNSTGRQPIKARFQYTTIFDKSACREDNLSFARENPERPKSRGNSLQKDKSDLLANMKMPMTPGNGSIQFKKMLFFKRNKGTQELDRIIGQALQDLRKPKQHKVITKIQRVSPKKDRSTMVKPVRTQKKKKEQYTFQLLMVLLCMIIMMVFISRL